MKNWFFICKNSWFMDSKLDTLFLSFYVSFSVSFCKFLIESFIYRLFSLVSIGFSFLESFEVLYFYSFRFQGLRYAGVMEV